MREDGTPVRDPGAQPERTGLAWRRTALTFVVCVGLMIRTLVVEGGDTEALTAAAAGILAWLGFVVVGHRRIAAMDAARPAPLSAASVGAAVLCALATALAALALVL